MPYALNALDNWFYHPLGSYSFDAKCEILADLGYDGINFTLWSEPAWADVPRFGEVKDRFGIDVSGMYAAIGSAGDVEGIARVRELLATVEGTDQLDLAVIGSQETSVNSDPAGDAALLKVLEDLLEIASARGITISLYPHTFCWLQTVEDAARLCRALEHPNLKLVFSSFHWFVHEGRELQRVLQAGMPYLNSVNICGSRKGPTATGLPATIELIDQGEVDNFYLVGSLKQLGYQGSISLQGYAIAGDAHANLRRSRDAFHDIESRIEAHPGWQNMKNDPLPNATGVE